MTATTIGLSRLKRKLDRLPKVARDEIAKAMEKSAAEIVEMMKRLVPVNTGALRDSIGWTWGEAPKGSLAIAVMPGPDEEMTITIYAGDDKAYYARWVEFGVVAQKAGFKVTDASGQVRKSRRTTSGQDAQPFFYVSYRTNRKRAKSRITRAINKSAKIVAAGG